MKYLLSVWTDDGLHPIQVNATVYDEAGSVVRIGTWTPEAEALASAIYEAADWIVVQPQQAELWEDSL